MPNRWTDFVKSWASENNMAYGCALTKPELKIAYYNKYPKTKKGNKKDTTPVKYETLEEALPSEEQAKKAVKVNITKKDMPNLENDIERLSKELDKKPSANKLVTIIAELKKLKELWEKGYFQKTNQRVTLFNNFLEKLREAKKVEQQKAKGKQAKQEKQAKGANAEKVLTNADLVRYIKEFTPITKITKTQLNDLEEEIASHIDFFMQLMYFVTSFDINFKNKKQKDKILKLAGDLESWIAFMKQLLIERLTFLAKQSGLDVDEDNMYWKEIDDMDMENRLDIRRNPADDSYIVGKDTENKLIRSFNYSFDNYKEIMEKMGVKQKDAVIILNKRMINRGYKTQFKEPK